MLRLRRLLLSLVVFLAGSGALAALSWRENRPEKLFTSAQSYWERARACRESGDDAGARRALERADVQLETLLADDQQPRHVSGLVLHYHVLHELSTLAAREEPPAAERSADLQRQALAAASRAAADATYAPAQALLLDHYFRLERYDLAAPYAANLLAHPPADPSQLPQADNYLAGAHFALAWQDLQGKTLFPRAALAHLQAAETLEKRLDAAATNDPPTRWRTVALRVRALHQLADHGRRETQRQGVLAPAATRDPALERDALVAELLERVQRERQQGAWTAHPPAPTNRHGLLDFVVLAAELTGDAAQRRERAELAVGVCEELARGPEALRPVARHAGELAPVIERLPVVERRRLAERLAVVAGQALKAGVRLDAETCQALARNAARAGDAAQVALLSRQVLTLAAEQGLAADHPAVREAHARLAWEAVSSDEPRKALEHLAALRSTPSAVLQLLDGWLAIREGRLTAGALALEQAARDPQMAKDEILHLGLAEAYLGLGRAEAALAHLQALEGGDDATRPLSPAALHLARCRCYLALGQREQAVREREQLAGHPEERTAVQLLRAREDYRQAMREVAAERLRDPEDLALLAEEVRLRMAHPEADPAWIAGGVLALPGSRLPAALVLDANQVRVEALLQSREAPEVEFLRARWLVERGRRRSTQYSVLSTQYSALSTQHEVLSTQYSVLGTQYSVLSTQYSVLGTQYDRRSTPYSLLDAATKEADTLLERLERTGPDSLRPRVQLLRTACMPIPTTPETECLLADLGVHTDGQLDELLAAASSPGREPYCAAARALAKGDYFAAARGYSKVLAFTSYRAAAEEGFLRSVAALAHLSRTDARACVTELGRTYPEDAAAFLTAARAALVLGERYGPDGMEGALYHWEHALAQQAPEWTARGLRLSALCWLAAGRSDLARLALDRALRASSSDSRTLLEAGRLALAEQDWNALLNHAGQLARTAGAEDVQAAEWRAAALEGLHDLAGARAAYEALLRHHPDHLPGYLGLVRVREQARDWSGALELVRHTRGRQHLAGEETLLRLEVRLLVRLGRRAEADRLAEQVWSRTSPEHASVIALSLAHGYFDASALDAVPRWAEHARGAARDPEALHAVLLLQGDLHLTRCLQLPPLARGAEARRAVAEFRAILERWPDDRFAANNLAWLLDEPLQDPKAALAVVEQLRRGRAGEVVPGDCFDVPVLDTLAQVYCNAHHPEAAAALCQEALRRYSQEPLVHLHLGRALRALQRADEARRELNEAARLADRKADADPAGRATWHALAEQARHQRDEVQP